MQTNIASISFILAAAALGVVTGCVSEQEKVARRACALDVAGDYGESRPAGTTAGSLTVSDESSKNDVKLVFTRGALYDGEQTFIDRFKNDADKTAVKASLDLGTGDDQITDDLVGGQNISDDFGNSSKIGVGAPDFEATPIVAGATDAKVHYRVALSIQNGTDLLLGKLTVTSQENRPKAGGAAGETELFSESKAFDVSFKRGAGVLKADQSDECKAAVDGKG